MKMTAMVSDLTLQEKCIILLMKSPKLHLFEGCVEAQEIEIEKQRIKEDGRASGKCD